MTRHVKITATLTAHAGKEDELKILLTTMASHCRAEPGNLCWDIWRDQSNHEVYVIDELYADMDAVSAHRETPHFKAYLLRINDLAERTSRVLNAVHVA